MSLKRKKFPSVEAQLESCNFGYKPHLSQLGVLNAQNFEIPLKTQESKKFEISFENFQKMLDGLKSGKRCL
jgi:hypothetical protein